MTGRRGARVVDEPRVVPPSVKLVVVAAVRETLHELPDSAGRVGVTRKQRQIMANAFPYIDVAQTSDDELLDQLRADIAKTLDRLS
jgi:hypothetical protein